jgi:hypothetical protein
VPQRTFFTNAGFAAYRSVMRSRDMKRVRRQRHIRRRASLLACGLGVVHLVSCTTPVALPEVKTPLATDLGCPVSSYGVEVGSPWFEFSDGTNILECAMAEFGACHPGSVDYQLSVGVRGELLALSVVGEAPEKVRACVTNHLRGAVLTPASDCRNQPVASTVRGNLEWGPDVGLRGSHGGVLGAVWPCHDGQHR